MSVQSPEPVYFRTVLVVEVLTRTEAFNGDFAELAATCIDGDASGDIKMRVVERCGEAEMAALLVAQGSDPGFLGIEADTHETDLCDECFAVLPASRTTVVSPSHLPSCSLHPDNVDAGLAEDLRLIRKFNDDEERS